MVHLHKMETSYILLLFFVLVISFGTGHCLLQPSRKNAAVNRLTKLFRTFSKSSDNSNLRIIYGTAADKNEYPWQAQTLYNDGFVCGGVVLNERTILTAAHCYKYPCHKSISISHAHRYKIVVGTHTVRRPVKTEQIGIVGKVVIHKRYNGRVPLEGYDVAIFHLTSPLKLSPAVQPVRLSDKKFDELALTNSQCYLSGWGQAVVKGSYGYPLPLDLQRVKTYVITNEVCQEFLGSVKIKKQHICTAYNGKSNSCKGDSGGPVGCYDKVGKFRLIGIVAFDACAGGYPTGHMRISHYRRWICRNALGGILL